MHQTPSLTVAYRIVEILARASVGLEEDVLPLLERAGIAPAERSSPEARVPLEKSDRLWEILVEHTGDEHIGLRLASRLDLEAYGPFGAAVRAATSVEETVANANRYGRLLHDAATWSLRREADVVHLSYSYEGTDRLPHRQAAAFALGGTAELFRRLIVRRWSPLEVCFQGLPPRDPVPYQSVFDAPVRFEQADNAIVFDAAVLEQRLISGDAGLSKMYRDQADKLLAQRSTRPADPNVLLAPIRAALVEALPRGEPSLEGIAHRLAMSPRTLQRRLRTQRTTFQTILDDTRRELTFSLLRTGEVRVGQVAFLVGYSDESAFRRAFKRWTSESPQAFRQRTTPSR